MDDLTVRLDPVREAVDGVLRTARTDAELREALRTDPVSVLLAAGIGEEPLDEAAPQQAMPQIPCTFQLTWHDCDPITCYLFTFIS
ncbi:MAG: hypothetical protein R3F59_12860 [Myxococcota bacterium]